MRFCHLLIGDIRFQAKYGFYFLYAVLTGIYVTALFVVPESWRDKAAVVLIFSDPASMGLFFMGAIVLLEKSQHTPCAFAVSPVCAAEYILAKTGALTGVSLIVAAVLALAAGIRDIPAVLLGVALSNAIFTLIGIIAATKIISLNQFILWTVPIEIVCFVPAVLHLFKITPARFRYYPINICMDMVSGSLPSAAEAVAVITLIIILFVLSKNCVLKMWSGMEGTKL